MSEDDRRLRRRSPGIRSVLGTFMIVMATAAATVLCILWFGRSTVSADPNPMDKQPETTLGLDNVWSTVSESATEQRPSGDHTVTDVEQPSVKSNFPKEADPVDQDDQLRAQGLSASDGNRMPFRNVPDRRTSHRLQTISRQGDWNVAADKWTTEQDGWTVYQDVYESGGSNAGNYGGEYQQSGNPQVNGIELTTKPINYPPPYGWWSQSRPTSADQNRDPATVSTTPAADPGADPKTTVATQNATAVDWRALGIVALVKFSLFALKTFAVVNSAMLVLFKVALAFLKFQLLVKSVKFVGTVAVSLPLLLTTSIFSPMLVSSVLSIPARVLQLLTAPVVVPAVPSGDPTPSSPSSPMPSPPTRQPNRGPVPSNRLWQFLSPAQFDVLDSLYERRHDSKRLPHDPAEMVLRKLLDSEKCVERIACRMALAERVGIMPFWMRWIVNSRSISKVIPNEKLESYLKTYDDVNNTIKTNTSTSGNWATWCSEHYNCSDTNLTNVKNTEK